MGNCNVDVALCVNEFDTNDLANHKRTRNSPPVYFMARVICGNIVLMKEPVQV